MVRGVTVAPSRLYQQSFHTGFPCIAVASAAAACRSGSGVAPTVEMTIEGDVDAARAAITAPNQSDSVKTHTDEELQQ